MNPTIYQPLTPDAESIDPCSDLQVILGTPDVAGNSSVTPQDIRTDFRIYMACAVNDATSAAAYAFKVFTAEDCFDYADYLKGVTRRQATLTMLDMALSLTQHIRRLGPHLYGVLSGDRGDHQRRPSQVGCGRLAALGRRVHGRGLGKLLRPVAGARPRTRDLRP
jgi:hypothetical protein